MAERVFSNFLDQNFEPNSTLNTVQGVIVIIQ